MGHARRRRGPRRHPGGRRRGQPGVRGRSPSTCCSSPCSRSGPAGCSPAARRSRGCGAGVPDEAEHGGRLPRRGALGDTGPGQPVEPDRDRLHRVSASWRWRSWPCPFVIGGPAEQPLITLLTFVAMASLWNLLAGFSGLTSFGQQAYIGVGAYALYLVAEHGINPFGGIVAAAIIAAVVSLPVSALVLRLSGGYFAVATLVVAATFQIIATLSPSVGGTTGVSVPRAGRLRRRAARGADLLGDARRRGGQRGRRLPARAADVRAGRQGRRQRSGRARPVPASGWGGSGCWPTWSPAGGAGAVGALIALQTLYVEPTSVVQHPVQRVHAVHGADRRHGDDRGPDLGRAGAVRAAGDAVRVRRLVPGDRGRPRGGRDAGRLPRAVGVGQRAVRLVAAPGRLPGAPAPPAGRPAGRTAAGPDGPVGTAGGRRARKASPCIRRMPVWPGGAPRPPWPSAHSAGGRRGTVQSARPGTPRPR